MTVNDINSRVDLPSYFSFLGLTGYQFTRMPRYGWFAHNHDNTDILSFTDILLRNSKTREPAEIYRQLKDFLREKRSFHDTPITFSEYVLNRLVRNVTEYQLWRLFYRACVNELNEDRRVTSPEAAGPRTVPALTYLQETGNDTLLSAGLGLATEQMIQGFGKLADHIPDKLKKGRYILPTWITPLHPASIEFHEDLSMTTGFTAWQNGEKGWYGKVEDEVVPHVSYLKRQGGFTWDRKADHWALKPVDIHADVPVPTLLTIWQESRKTQFVTHPLDRITTEEHIAQLRLNLKKLKYSQLGELESRLGVKLLADWKRQTYAEVMIGKVRFTQQDNRYFAERLGLPINRTDSTQDHRMEEVSNFIITLDRIVERQGRYYMAGVLATGDNYVPFEWVDEAFYHCGQLLGAIRRLFFLHRLGMPIVSSSWRNMLPEIVTRFNQYVAVDETESTNTPDIGHS